MKRLADIVILLILALGLQAQVETVVQDSLLCGETVEIAAQAKRGFHFVSWSDGVTTNPRRVVMTDDFDLTAIFEPDCYGRMDVPVLHMYEWLIAIDIQRLNDLGYIIREEDIKWYKIVGEPDDIFLGGDDVWVGSGNYLMVGPEYVGVGDFYAQLDVSHNEGTGTNLCEDVMRTPIVHVGATSVDEVETDTSSGPDGPVMLFNILGQQVDADYQGIIIQSDKRKYLKRR